MNSSAWGSVDPKKRQKAADEISENYEKLLKRKVEEWQATQPATAAAAEFSSATVGVGSPNISLAVQSQGGEKEVEAPRRGGAEEDEKEETRRNDEEEPSSPSPPHPPPPSPSSHQPSCPSSSLSSSSSVVGCVGQVGKTLSSSSLSLPRYDGAPKWDTDVKKFSKSSSLSSSPLLSLTSTLNHGRTATIYDADYRLDDLEHLTEPA